MGFFNISTNPKVVVNFYERLKGDLKYIDLGQSFLIAYGFIRSKGAYRWENKESGARGAGSLYVKLFEFTDQEERPMFDQSRLGRDTQETVFILNNVEELWLKVCVGWEISFITGNLGEKTRLTDPQPRSWKYNPSAQTQSEESVLSQYTRISHAVDPWITIKGGTNPIAFNSAIKNYVSRLRGIVNGINDTFEHVNSPDEVEINDDTLAKLPIEVSFWIRALENVTTKFDDVLDAIKDDDGSVYSSEEIQELVGSFNSAFEFMMQLPSGLDPQSTQPNWATRHQELLMLYNRGKEIYGKISSAKTKAALKKLVQGLVNLEGFQIRLTAEGKRQGGVRFRPQVIDFIREQNQMMSKYIYKIVELSKLNGASINDPEYAHLQAANAGLDKPVDISKANIYLVLSAMEKIGQDTVAIFNDIRNDAKDVAEANINREFVKLAAEPPVEEGFTVNSWEDAYATESDEKWVAPPAELKELDSFRVESMDLMSELSSALDAFPVADLESINDILLEIDRFLLVFDRYQSEIQRIVQESQMPQEETEPAFELPRAAEIRTALVKIANDCDSISEVELANKADNLLSICMVGSSGNALELHPADVVLTKEAKVRSKKDGGCPFGLNIPFDCSKIGIAIEDMYPLEDIEDEKLLARAKKINRRTRKKFYRSSEETGRCPFAEAVMDDSVICNYGEINEGNKSVEFGPNVSGAYPMMWSGLFTLPLSWGYSGAETYMSRAPGTPTNSPFGMSPGYQGYLRVELKKFAQELEEKGMNKLSDSLQELLQE